MKVLVTGGCGFIGSHLVDALLSNGADVVIVDDLSSGFERNLNPEARFYRTSVCDAELGTVFQRELPEAVFHLAAQTMVTRSVTEPGYDATVNIIGGLNVILNSIRAGVKRLVYASSCALYGKPEYLPIDENHPVNSLAPYGVSKHTLEHYLEIYRCINGFSYAALRYANVYGPRQNPRGEGGVVAIFSGKLLAGEQPIIYGAGNKTRDYVYVGDVVRANLLALDSKATGIFNIGTGIETSDKTVYEVISRACGNPGEPRYLPERPGEIGSIYLDCRRAYAELGWQPTVSFEDGVKTALDYYRSELVRT